MILAGPDIVVIAEVIPTTAVVVGTVLAVPEIVVVSMVVAVPKSTKRVVRRMRPRAECNTGVGTTKGRVL